MLVMVLSQIESVLSVFARSGFGKTVKMTSTESPLQLLAEGRSLYVTVSTVKPVLSILWLISVVPVTWLENPVRVGLLANALHVKIVPETLEVSAIVAIVLSQMEAVLTGFSRSGFGLTVTTMSVESPKQLFAEGRTR